MGGIETGASTMRLVVLAAIDPAARDTVAGGWLLGDDSVAVLQYNHVLLDDAARVTRRLIGTSGIIYLDELDEGDCACCRVREDLIGTLQHLVDQGNWERAVLSLPVGAPVGSLAAQLDTAIADGSLTGVVLSSVVVAVDRPGVADDLFGDDLLDERGLAMSSHDRRAVGEALGELIDYADLVIGTGEAADPGDAVLRQLAGSRYRPEWTMVEVAALFGARHDVAAAGRRIDPLHVTLADHAQHESAAWSLDLHVAAPVHPGRLLERLEDLALGRFRSRGYLWLPNRPDTPCAWDGGGGQLSIGSLPGWQERAPSCRLIITGVEPGERERVRATFADVLCTPEEIATSRWSEDDLAPWLGPVPQRAKTDQAD
ncbi:hypothetical protein MLP_19750 [Microlunatus phosphovorus NM-1]|uniref:CobW C-terminal domain-containing protein n=1 Tax=Microlunatus phosphovorus (strain ATCC 700054 / DSM 10555 / JCM 9379 / NBRC 101784 / NCIMB 13414 / VKM Ac-1990 / NM-1) TaxID=1032480 RepID=F5XTB7_MICPN|nr:GTP-binding protein [Microlunatus phosphovorus]BAK34989.1 hypothetical protein MLP_19750 [Microlunatus phosphovorus NM-1]